MHEAPLTTQLISSQLLVGLVWYLIGQQRINVYLGTVSSVLAAQGDDDGWYAALQTALLPTGLVFVPVVAAAHRQYGTLGTMQFVTLLAGLQMLWATRLPLRWQPATFLLFAAHRMASLSTFAIYMAQVFGPSASATPMGLLVLLGGVVSLSLGPIGYYVEQTFSGDWTLVYAACALMSLPQLALLCMASWRWKRHSHDAPEGSYERSLAVSLPAKSSDAFTPFVSDAPYRRYTR